MGRHDTTHKWNGRNECEDCGVVYRARLLPKRLCVLALKVHRRMVGHATVI